MVGSTKQAMYIKRDNQASSCNHCFSGKTINITQPEWVSVTLGIQHSMRMRYIVKLEPVRLCYIFPHYLKNGTIFWKKKLLNTKCVFWFPLQLSSETFLIIRTERGINKNVWWSSCKVRVILVRFEWHLIIFDSFLKTSNIKVYEKPSSGSQVVSCGQTVGRTDMTKIIITLKFVCASSYNSNKSTN